MNRELDFRPSLSAFVLPLFLFVSFFSPEGTLLCFGKDGHIAIEFVDECNEAFPGSHLEGMESDACGPCTDVRFFSSPVCTNNPSYYAQTLPLMSSSQEPLSLPSKDLFTINIDPPDFSYHKTLSGLHSVVLLI